MLRGFCALFVLFNHSYGWLQNNYVQSDLGKRLFAPAFVGVDVFFVLSGFIISYVTAVSSQQKVAPFLVKRFFRLMPLAWAVLILYGFAKGNSVSDLLSNSNFIKSLFLLPVGNSAPPSFGYSYLNVLWTLTYEVLFYIIFAFSMCVSKKYRSAVCTLGILIFYFTIQFTFQGHLSLNTHSPMEVTGFGWLNGLVGCLGNPMMFYFVIGMFSAEIFNILPNRKIEHIEYLSIILLLFAISSLWMVVIPYNRFITIGGFATLIMWALLILEKWGDPRPPKIFVYFGSLTFSLYLVHVLVMEFFYLRRLPELTFFYARFSGFPKLIFYTTLSVVFSIVFYQIIEKPSISLGRRVLSRYFR